MLLLKLRCSWLSEEALLSALALAVTLCCCFCCCLALNLSDNDIPPLAVGAPVGTSGTLGWLLFMLVFFDEPPALKDVAPQAPIPKGFAVVVVLVLVEEEVFVERN